MKHIHKLTGLRGLAALIVFISHSANEAIIPAVFGKGFGQIGVMLFFVLSGFLMAHLYIYEDFTKENVKRYIFARIGRVFPLYFLLLLFSVAMTHLLSPDSFYPFKFVDAESVLRALLLIDALYVFWTIPVEVQFYVVFIGFWALYKKGFNKIILCVFVLATMIPGAVIYLSLSTLPQIVSTYSYIFFIGVATALLHGQMKHTPGIKMAANFLGLPALALLFVNLPELRSQFGLAFTDIYFLRIWGDPVNWLVIYTLFMCAVLNASSLFILDSRFFVYLGSVSYGFYLIHYPVLIFFSKNVDIAPILKFILAFVFTLFLSHISFKYFEKPFGRKIRNYGKPVSG